MKIILAGSTGLVGTYCLDYLNKNEAITHVYELVRNERKSDNQKVKSILFDWEKRPYSLPSANAVICCLGTTIKKAGSKDRFARVDFSYVVELAKTAKANGIENFAVVSAMGADEHSRIYYNQVKGLMEQQLLALDFEQLSILRPSMILGDRKEFRLGELIGKFFMTLFFPVLPANYKAIHGKQIAKCLIYSCTSKLDKTNIINSGDIKKMSKLLKTN